MTGDEGGGEAISFYRSPCKISRLSGICLVGRAYQLLAPRYEDAGITCPAGTLFREEGLIGGASSS